MVETWKQMRTPHDRLAWSRRAAGHDDATSAADAMGVPPGTYLSHENGSRGLARAAQRYADFYRISLDWLLAGRGEPKPSGNKSANPSLIDSFDPDHSDAFISHDGHRTNIPEGEIPHVSSRLGMGHRTDEQLVEIPAGDGSVAAVPVIDTWKIPKDVLRRRLRGAVTSLHIVECEGDSMEPRIHDGDFVFIDTSRRVPSPPGIFALNDGFGQTLKRLEIVPNTEPPRVKIIPENARHESYERDLEEVRIIGRYLCRLTMD